MKHKINHLIVKILLLIKLKILRIIKIHNNNRKTCKKKLEVNFFRE